LVRWNERGTRIGRRDGDLPYVAVPAWTMLPREIWEQDFSNIDSAELTSGHGVDVEGMGHVQDEDRSSRCLAS
jgi:hypothetical protein